MKLLHKPLLLLLAALAIALLADAWRSARRDSQQLAATLAAQNSILQQASQHEKQRDTQLAATLAAIEAQKRAVHTPEQAVQNLPKALPPLPLPITIHTPTLSEIHPMPAPPEAVPAYSGASPTDYEVLTKRHPLSTSDPDSDSDSDQTTITIPQPDLIPLYNALQDCRAAQAQTITLQQDLSDEKARTAALQKERDASLTAAHGGPLLQRLKRAAKWFALGAALGAAIPLILHPQSHTNLQPIQPCHHNNCLLSYIMLYRIVRSMVALSGPTILRLFMKVVGVAVTSTEWPSSIVDFT